MCSKISADVANLLGHYVYGYVDPRDDKLFYVGKGVGSRAYAHLEDSSESDKVAHINDILAAGYRPRIDIIAYGLRDDLEASRVEAALIETLGIDNLTNAVRGLSSTTYPRRPLADIILEHESEPIDVKDPTLLIRINREFRYGMHAVELYEATRGVWVIGERRNRAKYAMPVYDGLIREVYEIESWHRAGTTPYETRNQIELSELRHKRWEFVGHIAPTDIRETYLGRSVAHLFRKGQQSPIVGVNVG